MEHDSDMKPHRVANTTIHYISSPTMNCEPTTTNSL